MLNKIYSILVYLSLILSGMYYSFVIRIHVVFADKNELLGDPKDVSIIHQEIAVMTHVVNISLVLPITFILTIMALYRKKVHWSTVVLFLINCISVYLLFFTGADMNDWIFD